jgi:predicted chitinase
MGVHACCSQQEVQRVVQELQQELQSAKVATDNLHAQYAAQQAHWEGIVRNLQVQI